MKILALDMGGTFIKWALMDKATLNILEKGRYDTKAKNHSGLEIVWNMSKFAQQMKNKHKDIECVCSTMVGIIDTDRYVVLSPNHTLRGYEGMHIKEEFSKYCKLPLYVANDVKAAALGEINMGALKGCKNVNAVVMALGTGIAGAVVIDGKNYMGNNYASGECGQMLVNGNLFEMYYSVPALIVRCEQVYGKTLTGEGCLALALTNVKVKRVVDEWYDGIAKAIMYYIYIVNPKYVIIGGKIAEDVNFSIERLYKIIMKLAQKPLSSFQQVEILKAKLGNDAALYGVASLCKK